MQGSGPYSYLHDEDITVCGASGGLFVFVRRIEIFDIHAGFDGVEDAVIYETRVAVIHKPGVRHVRKRYNSTSDSAQVWYFQAMGGGDAQTWSSEMPASLDTIEGSTSNFAAFVPSGELHCILPRENFYTVSADGTMLVDWLGELLSKGSVDSAKCAENCDATTP